MIKVPDQRIMVSADVEAVLARANEHHQLYDCLRTAHIRMNSPDYQPLVTHVKSWAEHHAQDANNPAAAEAAAILGSYGAFMALSLEYDGKPPAIAPGFIKHTFGEDPTKPSEALVIARAKADQGLVRTLGALVKNERGLYPVRRSLCAGGGLVAKIFDRVVQLSN